jgi:hypothetical protein
VNRGFPTFLFSDTISFVNEEGNNTNTIESKCGHVKAFLKSYKKPDYYIYHFAH